MSVGGVTETTFDGELTDDDLDPVFELVSLMGDISEDFVEWYQQVAEDLDVAGGWLIWFSETIESKKLEGKDDDATLAAFTSWMDDIGFNYTKYFRSSTLDSGERIATQIRGDFSTSQVNELLALEVEAISNDASQANVLTTGMIGNFNNSTQELISMIDSLRSAWRGHIRA